MVGSHGIPESALAILALKTRPWAEPPAGRGGGRWLPVAAELYPAPASPAAGWVSGPGTFAPCLIIQFSLHPSSWSHFSLISPFFSLKLLLTSVQRLGGSLQRNHNLSLHACFGFCPPLRTLAPPEPPSATTRQGLNWAGGSGGHMWQ